MEKVRKPFQGVLNIIRFNWHFYVLAFGLILTLILIKQYTTTQLHLYIDIGVLLVVFSTILSIIVSFFVYDYSSLYKLSWLDTIRIDKVDSIVNVHAGFDESSVLLKKKFSSSHLQVFDFYNPLTHTEVSIQRARKAYPPFPGTIKISTGNLQLDNASADVVFVILAAHEVRNRNERQLFFRELKRILAPTGKVIVAEHLRDAANLLAFNFGFFHFYSKNCWYQTFLKAGFIVEDEIKITPFITTFILKVNGAPS